MRKQRGTGKSGGVMEGNGCESERGHGRGKKRCTGDWNGNIRLFFSVYLCLPMCGDLKQRKRPASNLSICVCDRRKRDEENDARIDNYKVRHHHPQTHHNHHHHNRLHCPSQPGQGIREVKNLPLPLTLLPSLHQ